MRNLWRCDGVECRLKPSKTVSAISADRFKDLPFLLASCSLLAKFSCIMLVKHFLIAIVISAFGRVWPSVSLVSSCAAGQRSETQFLSRKINGTPGQKSATLIFVSPFLEKTTRKSSSLYRLSSVFAPSHGPGRCMSRRAIHSPLFESWKSQTTAVSMQNCYSLILPSAGKKPRRRLPH